MGAPAGSPGIRGALARGAPARWSPSPAGALDGPPLASAARLGRAARLPVEAPRPGAPAPARGDVLVAEDDEALEEREEGGAGERGAGGHAGAREREVHALPETVQMLCATILPCA